MKRKVFTAILTATASICLAFGLSACAKTAETKPSGIPLPSAYTMATELGYGGTREEFASTVSEEEKTIVSVAQNSNGEVIVTYSDGSTVNLGVPSHTHSYGNWVLETEATCTSIGYRTRTCTTCGDRDYDFLEATGHTPKYGVTHNQSIHMYECKNCGEIVTAEHDFDGDGVCTFCEYKADYTLGLTYLINNNHASYTVRIDYDKSALENLVIPSTYKGLPVIRIDVSGFTSCTNLKSAVIPDSVTEIGTGAFWNCSSLTDITLPQNIAKMAGAVFYNCTALENVTLPETLTEGGQHMFRNCTALKEINLPESWTEIPMGMYYGCTGLESFELPANITSIGVNAFSRCNFTTVTIPETVTKIDRQVFAYCKNLETVVLHDKLTTIGVGAFGHCTSLTEIELPDSLETLGGSAFIYCSSLTKISLPAGNTKYGINVFKGCTALESVTLNEGFTEIPEGLLSGCASISELVIPHSVTLIKANALLNTTALTEITYNGTMAEWKAVKKESGWKTEDNNMGGLTVKCTDGTLEYIW